MNELDPRLKAIRYAAIRCEGDYVPNGNGEVAISDLLLEAGAELERLRAALKPFSTQIELIECTTDHTYSDDETWPLEDCLAIKLGDLRRARNAVEQTAREQK